MIIVSIFFYKIKNKILLSIIWLQNKAHGLVIKAEITKAQVLRKVQAELVLLAMKLEVIISQKIDYYFI